MSNFIKILDSVLEAMIAAHKEDLCMAVYPDSICEDNALVMFMDYDNCYESMHAVMKDLYDRLSAELGYPVNICHNHPTDEILLIHGHKDDSQEFNVEHCCKENTIRAYYNWVTSGRIGYREELVVVFKSAEIYAEARCCKAEEVLRGLDWNKDPQTQMLQMFINIHG